MTESRRRTQSAEGDPGGRQREDGGVAAILIAAGRSQRMGGADKLWAELDGVPLVGWSLRALAAMADVGEVVVVAPAARHAALLALAGEAPASVRCVEGGARRQDSVAAGVAAAPGAAWYLVHDAARPLVTAALARSVLAAARDGSGAAIPAVAPTDTIKRVDGAGRVVETLDRAWLRAVQTPQAFAGELLRRAHAEVHADVTDDASMVERLGVAVAVVPGDPRNLKVTTPADLVVARALLAAEREARG
ncbi:MAG: 2-C-methyl-D-erythritol 4-phosphate cytidylyltransferase [Chloroflexi bacterium]|nr:2-C-methyl-D-erythritol 4-phosphate cytidylyltransferase [Chloroflexota bacterium]